MIVLFNTNKNTDKKVFLHFLENLTLHKKC